MPRKNPSKQLSRSKTPKPFDKYDYYVRAVQAPEDDAEFFQTTFGESFPKRRATSLREDFCGTFNLCAEWVKSDPKNTADGIDLDPEPLAYGRENTLARLSPSQQNRIRLHQTDVLGKKLPSTDIVVAVNFSFYIFKERQVLLDYLRNCYRTLNKPGMMIIDCFGGPLTLGVNEDKSDRDDFVYYWDQSTYNPVTADSIFYIHFRIKGEKRRERVFTYDWRMWTLPELQDLLKEAGFSKVHVYWEGSTRAGEGNGIFKRSRVGDDSDAWIAYLAAEKT